MCVLVAVVFRTSGLRVATWRIMGLSKYGYKYPKWGYK